MTDPGPAPAGRIESGDRRLELIGFGALVVLAALLRLPGLAERGPWDADQGTHLLALRSFVVDGHFPLLGPATSIGDFHHGVLYYLVLAPVAALTHVDPVAITVVIALAGVAAVAATAWLARAIAGPLAGLIAGLLYAVSSTAIGSSIFIWNPNLVGPASAIALAAAWKAWQSRQAGWWVVAGGAAVATMHFHVLGLILTPIVAALLVADARRRRREADREGMRRLRRAAIAWILIAVASYVPLLIHELGSGGSEIRGALAYATGGGESAAVALPARLVIIGWRVLSWPLAGLITIAPIVSVAAAGLVAGLAVWLAIGRRAPATTLPERLAARWLGLGLAWTIGALAILSSSLAIVIPGLPNDSYHAFADPMVIVLVAIGLSAALRRVPAAPAGAARASMVGRAGAAVILVGLVAWNVAHKPPSVAPDGGWQAAQAAAARVIDRGGAGPLVLSSLPTFKPADALRLPLENAGADVLPSGPNGASLGGPGDTRVILCDELFRDAIGADCGGPAETSWLANPASGLTSPQTAPPALIDRFEAAPGRWVSIYRP